MDTITRTKKQHLCDRCFKGFAWCGSNHVFGDGVGNDNVIQCDSFEIRRGPAPKCFVVVDTEEE